jgi:hypothetical protein
VITHPFYLSPSSLLQYLPEFQSLAFLNVPQASSRISPEGLVLTKSVMVRFSSLHAVHVFSGGPSVAPWMIPVTILLCSNWLLVRV